MKDLELDSTNSSASDYQTIDCALCGHGATYRVLYPNRLKDLSIEPSQLFSAKRIPGLLHFRIVRCNQCGLTYSNPIYTEAKIKELYRKTDFIDDDFIKKQYVNVIKDYSWQLEKALVHVKQRGRLLDVGCGNGFFLKAARQFGFEEVCGVEPGQDALSKADPDIRPFIINDSFRAGLLPSASFDVVCSFHVLDHIVHPLEFLRDIRDVLKPSGIALLIMHNVEFILTRLVGERAPMFHIEHIYLWNKGTLRQALERTGFNVLCNEDLTCSFTLAHVLKMLPIPAALKKTVLRRLDGRRIANIPVRLMPGDMVAIAQRAN